MLETTSQALDFGAFAEISLVRFPAQWLLALETACKADCRSCLQRRDSYRRFSAVQPHVIQSDAAGWQSWHVTSTWRGHSCLQRRHCCRRRIPPTLSVNARTIRQPPVAELAFNNGRPHSTAERASLSYGRGLVTLPNATSARHPDKSTPAT